jgi:hypothetical protein
MTIKWGDPIECNGVRPDWLRDDEQRIAFQDHHGDWYGDATTWFARELDSEQPQHIRLPVDHPAYVALARGFTPWSGGESAPGDWDGGDVLQRCELKASSAGPISWVWPWRAGASEEYDIIGYRKRAVHTDGSRSSGQPPPLATFVPVARMTEAEARDWIVNHTYIESTAHILHALGQLGLVETTAERFTRETGHEVTEAVEAALNWKDTQS